MSKYIILYKGPATDVSQMPKEQVDAIMAKWKEWMGELGAALIDVGAPMGENASLVDDGSDGKAVDLTGYSIIEATDLEDAKTKCKNHPFLSEGKGSFAVDIYKLDPVPM